jgi:hypothetical protein
VVDKVLEHDHPAGGSSQRLGLRERLAVQRGQRTPVDAVPGEPLGGLVRNDIHRGTGRGQRREAAQPTLGEQHRAHWIASRHSPADHLRPLCDEQPLRGLQAGAQLHIR